MTKTYKFSCGCSFPIIGDPLTKNSLPLMEVDPTNLPSCDIAWDIFSRGDTKGIFQLESDLGKQWSKKLRPKTVEHLTALGALIRPGALRSVDDKGVSMTAHYCRIVNGEEQISSYHPIVDEALKSTYGSLVFQEQAMELSRVIAGFTLQEADMLRKAMGKKSSSEMAKCKKMFIEGAKKIEVVSEDQAEEIFGWIEQSQKYSFNRSHSCCYGLIGYDTAYLKSHFPVQFFTSWLYFAKDKADSQLEISDLIEDAKKFNIIVEPPDLMMLNSNFYTDGISIWFGITDVKGIGQSQFEKIKLAINNYGKSIDSWEEFVVKCSDEMPKSSIEKLIAVNGLRKFGSKRKVLLAEFNAWCELTDKEREWIKANAEITNISDMILNSANTKKEGGCCSSVKRVEVLKSIASMIKNPPSPLIDIPSWVCWIEKDSLGISLTYNATDSCDTSSSNTTCKEYLDGKNGYMVFGVEVRRSKEVLTKAGKTPGSRMAFLSISDATGKIDDVICFPNSYKDFASLLKEGNTVLIQGERDKKSDSLLVKTVVQI
jgi:DNA polymerase-3 subunit alpha